MTSINQFMARCTKGQNRVIHIRQMKFVDEMIRMEGQPQSPNALYHFEQFELLANGVRDGRISDNALCAWEKIGLKLYTEDPERGLVPTKLV